MNFERIKSQPGTSLVVFYSLTCGPCKAMKPAITELCEQYGVTRYEVNIASDMDAVRALGIRGVPTLVKVEDGASKVLSTGGLSVAQIRKVLEDNGLVTPTN